MAYSTIDEEFNENYAGAGLQPSVGERAVAGFNKTRQLGNNVTRVTGVSMKQGGRAMQKGGKKMMKAGAAMSRTGLGAVVGVPLMAAGATMAGAGAINQKVGNKATNQAQGTKKFLRAKGLTGVRKDIKKRVSATRVNMTALSTATPIWFTLQLPLALAAMFALGMAGLSEGVAEQLMGIGIVEFLYSIYDGVTDMVEYLTGINLNIFETWSGFNQVLFGGLTMLVFLIGIFTLFAMAIMYTLSGVKCFTGDHAAFKISLFIFAILGYLMPILNIFPWFMLWGIVVWRYPK
jgi:hypothetical protein